ncbi:hypothetical protein SAMN05421640_1139 [Ekhidna lutea]|uniref:Uncharacterized protein n=1 Tax=Ekhidna lutea TaxID=447679 RepID=A0A239H673_EKHLU|nr:hypothetical protein SAMN05421640_1139 [Ekhidna lutea]
MVLILSAIAVILALSHLNHTIMNTAIQNTQSFSSKKLKETLLELAESNLRSAESKDLISVRGIEKVKSRLSC